MRLLSYYAVLLLLLTSMAVGIAEPARVDVFTAGQDGYHTFRIPSFIVTPKGTLIAARDGRAAALTAATSTWS
jgi:hypothetical protein